MTPKEVLTAFHAAFVARDVDGLCALCPHMSLAACFLDQARARPRTGTPSQPRLPCVRILTSEIPMKILGRIVVVLVSLLVVAGVIVYFTVDGIVKRTIEKQGTTSLQLTTTLNSAHLSLLDGKVKLNKLGIASPPGFSAPRMLARLDRKSTRLNSSHGSISYAVFCLKKKNAERLPTRLRRTASPRRT